MNTMGIADAEAAYDQTLREDERAAPVPEPPIIDQQVPERHAKRGCENKIVVHKIAW